ncbi:DUF1330 domain-containing protein [Amycolatopsis sp. NPDC051061]|uniref:DUF1330 domain-containing protein n=1 Tax=Amycolatopsis sp. NPDC051061 TaxID=3155042 RepID=UPI0034155472
MPYYMIGLTHVQDFARFGEYSAGAVKSVAAHGGRYLAAGEVVEVCEGDFQPHGGAVIEFDSAEAAKRWYGSPEYAPFRKLRGEIGSTNLVMMRSADPQS